MPINEVDHHYHTPRTFQEPLRMCTKGIEYISIMTFEKLSIEQQCNPSMIAIASATKI